MDEILFFYTCSVGETRGIDEVVIRYNSLSSDTSMGHNNRLENMGSSLEVPRVEQHYSSVSYASGLFIKRVLGERGVVSEDNCVFHLYNFILRRFFARNINN